MALGSRHARSMTAQETWSTGQESGVCTQHCLSCCVPLGASLVPNRTITDTAGRGRKPRLVLDTERKPQGYFLSASGL